ncbi:hypothetical protein RRG08_027787 [Elysia crispata]|uniref:Uncharacterized protein n=1 Tax=Elysia crispata TaxID=231223 RepID=A0AAE1DD90_9GAST|nr:hypothetical protein RRG08_027787 [Elysia crispata]
MNLGRSRSQVTEYSQLSRRVSLPGMAELDLGVLRWLVRKPWPNEQKLDQKKAGEELGKGPLCLAQHCHIATGDKD